MKNTAGIITVITLLSACGNFLLAQSSKVANDSAFFYLENGQLKNAEQKIKEALGIKNTDVPESARSILILAQIKEARGFAATAIQLYRQIKNPKEIFEVKIVSAALNGIGRSLTFLGKYDSVLYFLTAAKQLDSIGVNGISNQLGFAQYWQSQNQDDKALPFYQNAYDNSKINHDVRNEALALAGIGGVYFNQDHDMKKAMEFYNKSIARCDSSKHADIIARNYARLANASMVLGKTSDAEKYLKRAKKITDLSGNLPVRSYVLASFAILMSEKNNIAASIPYAEEALAIKSQLGQKRQMQNDLLNLSGSYMMMKRYDDARKTLTQALRIAKELRDFVYLQYFYQSSSDLDSITGNYSGAYSNMKQAMAFKDSVVSLKKIKAVEEIRAKYEAEQKEKIIAEKELQLEHQRLKQYVIIGTLSISILIFFIVVLWLRNRHRIRLQAMRLQTIVQTQEEVQQSIARDIHDGLVQVLGAAKISLQAINPEADRVKIQERIKETSRIIDEACAEARGISHQILPYSLMKDGLVPAIDELLRKSIPDQQYEFVNNCAPERLHENIEINIYRIAQELVSNIIKHAGALRTKIELNVDHAILTLTCNDNGRGFDVQQKGVGITNIMTRAELIGGSVKIESNPGKGTTVQVKVPV